MLRLQAGDTDVGLGEQHLTASGLQRVAHGKARMGTRRKRGQKPSQMQAVVDMCLRTNHTVTVFPSKMNTALSFLLGGMRMGCSERGLEGSPAHRAAPSWGCAWGRRPHGRASASGTVPDGVAGVCCPQHPPTDTELSSGRLASAASLPQRRIGAVSWFGATAMHPACWRGDRVTYPRDSASGGSPAPGLSHPRSETSPGAAGGKSGENWPVPIARHRCSPPAAFFPAEVRAARQNTRLLPSSDRTNISLFGT